MGLIVLGILSILVGLALFCVSLAAPIGLAVIMKMDVPEMEPMKRLISAMQRDPLSQINLWVGVLISLVFGLVLIVGSIGLFRVRLWAWKLAVSALAAYLIWTPISLAINHFVINPRVLGIVEEMIASGELGDLEPEMEEGLRAQFSSSKNVIIYLGCCMPFPVILLVGLLLPGIRKQFFPPTDEMAPPIEEPRGPPA